MKKKSKSKKDSRKKATTNEEEMEQGTPEVNVGDSDRPPQVPKVAEGNSAMERIGRKVQEELNTDEEDNNEDDRDNEEDMEIDEEQERSEEETRAHVEATQYEAETEEQDNIDEETEDLNVYQDERMKQLREKVNEGAMVERKGIKKLDDSGNVV